MINWLFKSRCSPTVVTVTYVPNDSLFEGALIPRLDISQLHRMHEKEIHRLQQQLGLDQDRYEALILSVIGPYFEYGHLLPAIANPVNAPRTLLVRQGLLRALRVLRNAESHLYALHEAPAIRKDLDIEWRSSLVIATLIYELSGVFIDYHVTSLDQTLHWNPYSTSLYDWLLTHDLDEYRFEPTKSTSSQTRKIGALWLSAKIISSDTLDFLSSHNMQIFESMQKMLGEFGPMDVTAQYIWSAHRLEPESTQIPVYEGNAKTHPQADKFEALRKILALDSQAHEASDQDQKHHEHEANENTVKTVKRRKRSTPSMPPLDAEPPKAEAESDTCSDPTIPETSEVSLPESLKTFLIVLIEKGKDCGLKWVGDRLWIPHPNTARHLVMEPQDIIHLLHQNDALDYDVMSPYIKVRVHKGEKGLFLKSSLAKPIRQLKLIVDSRSL